MTENIGPGDIIGKTSSSQKLHNFAGWDREGKGCVFPTIFQVFEQKSINLENSQLTKSHNLPALDACSARH